MSLRALLYAYVIGGLTFIPLLLAAAVAYTIYTSEPVVVDERVKGKAAKEQADAQEKHDASAPPTGHEQPRPRSGWLTVRRTFEQKETDASYVNFVRSYLDSRSKDPKRSRPKDMWYTVLKGDVLYLYEDESMTECEAAIDVALHKVVVYPEDLMDGELFTKRNAICLKPLPTKEMASVSKEMKLEREDVEKKVDNMDASERTKQKEHAKLLDAEEVMDAARDEALDPSTPWFIFVRSCVEMEDWYHALLHASTKQSYIDLIFPVFRPDDMNRLVETLDVQPDVIPMRWLNALVGRLFYSFYRTEQLEAFIIGRLMKKLSKVKIPSFLQDLSVSEVSVGNTAPTFSKPMLKELTKEGDASLEVRIQYKGEIRITIQATAIISLGQRFKSYNVQLVLAAVLRELDGNLLIKVKRPPSSRLWYAFTSTPHMVLDVEPVVSERQIKWSMILGTIESKLKEIIAESVVLPNMDDISFFESSAFDKRGGIWVEAQRKRRLAPIISLNPSATQDTRTEPVTVPKAESIAALPASSTPDIRAEGPPQRAETIAGPELASSSPPSKPRIGLTNGRNDAYDAVVQSLGLNEDPSSKDKTKPEPSADASTHKRSASVSGDAGLAKLEEAASEASQQKSFPSSSDNDISFDYSSGGEAFQPSSSRTRSISSISDASAFTDGSDLGQASSSNGSKGLSPSFNSSFFSKVKAADKQALANQAKAAMRKWSANWSGFRKDPNNAAGSSEHAQEDGEERFEKTQRTDSIREAAQANAKNTYAAMRDTIAGWKEQRERERERAHQAEASTAGRSSPLNVPSMDRGRRSPSSERGGGTHPSSLESERSNSLNPQALKGAPSRPSAPRLSGEMQPPDLHAIQHSESQSQQHEDKDKNRDAKLVEPPEEPIVPPAPIRVQPSQGATMKIPGIHASHKNEVMSLGYTPPPPPVPPTPERKLMAPVYNLFKSGTSPQQTASSPAGLGEHSEGGVSESEQNSDVPSLSLSNMLTASTAPSAGDAFPLSKPTPPPLPPRSSRKSSISAGVVSASAPSIPSTPSPTEKSSTTSQASEALKQIVCQDESKRQSLELNGSLSRNSSLAKRFSGGLFPDSNIEALKTDNGNAVNHAELPDDASLSMSDSQATLMPISNNNVQIEPRTSSLKPPPLPPRKPSSAPAST